MLLTLLLQNFEEKLSDPMTDQALKATFKIVDHDGDKFLNIKEFLDIFRLITFHKFKFEGT